MGKGEYIQRNLLELVLSSFFLVLILFSKLAAIYIVLMALVIAWSYVNKQIQFSLNRFSLLFVGLYLCYLAGTFWTQDWSEASRYLENKVSFVLLPFIFSFRKKDGFNISLIYGGLIFAVLTAFLYGISIGIPCYLKHMSFPYCFLKSHLTPFMHPTYMSVFVLISLAATVSLIKHGKISRLQGYILIIVLSIYNTLLLSLAGLLFFGILVFWFFLNWLSTRVSNLRMITLLLSGLAIAIFMSLKLPFIKEEISSVVGSMKQYAQDPEKYVQGLPENTSSTQTRLVMWSVTIEEIKKHPLGIGTGNLDIVLGENLRSKGNEDFAAKQYNPHNQFLHTMLEVGPIAFLLMLMISIGGIVIGFKEDYFMLSGLSASLFLNSLFESMLQLQAGIIFYPFFFMLLGIAQRSNNKTI